MQQAIYHSSNRIAIQTTKTTATGSGRTGLARRIMQSWDLYGVLALMGSSAAYGVFALARLGL